jgi:hypothetical protein
MARGGKQPGAGRPKGSTTKPRMSDYLTEKDVKQLVSKALELAKDGNDNMLKFVLEQHLGKAIQPVEGSFTGDVNITFHSSFNKNGTS